MLLGNLNSNLYILGFTKAFKQENGKIKLPRAITLAAKVEDNKNDDARK